MTKRLQQKGKHTRLEVQCLSWWPCPCEQYVKCGWLRIGYILCSFKGKNSPGTPWIGRILHHNMWVPSNVSPLDEPVRSTVWPQKQEEHNSAHRQRRHHKQPGEQNVACSITPDTSTCAWHWGRMERECLWTMTLKISRLGMTLERWHKLLSLQTCLGLRSHNFLTHTMQVTGAKRDIKNISLTLFVTWLGFTPTHCM